MRPRKRYFVLILLLGAPLHSQATTWTVPGSYPSLTDAISGAFEDDEIQLTSGYTASIADPTTVLIDKSITITLADPNSTVQLPRLDIDVGADAAVTIGNTTGTGSLQLPCANATGDHPLRWNGGGSGATIATLTLNNITNVTSGCSNVNAFRPLIGAGGGQLTLSGASLQPFGNAVAAGSLNLIIEDTTIEAAAAGSGGVFYVGSGDENVTIERTTLADTTGFGFSISDAGDVVIRDTNTTGTSGNFGGAMALVDNLNTTLERVVVEGNTANNTAAVRWESTPNASLVVTDSTFLNNSADNTAAALYLSRSGNGTQQTVIEGSLFCGNSVANVGASDIWAGGSDFTFQSNIFAFSGNDTAIELAANADYTVLNNTFTDLSHSAIVNTAAGSTFDIRNNAFYTVQSNIVLDTTSPTPTQYDGGYNFVHDTSGQPSPSGLLSSDFWRVERVEDVEPLFLASNFDCDDITGLYLQPETALQAGSPLIDAGDPAIVDLDTTPSDIGAFGGPGANLVDEDLDGWYDNTDCNDNDNTIHPDATEVWYDGVDQDCDEANDYDQDGDGYVREGDDSEAGGSAPLTGDCGDTATIINPGVIETWYDGTDQNCNDDNDFDQDGDGYVREGDESEAGGTAPNVGDCVDDPAGANGSAGDEINPNAAEVWYDGFDQDCADDNDYDQDGDGYVPSIYNVQAGGTATGVDDCDDEDDDRYPAAPEVWYDGVDQDCDGGNDYDQDGDGFGCDPTVDSSCAGNDGVDCDDDPTDDVSGQPSAADVFPTATETWYDGIDQDCAGDNDYDQDGDGFECNGDRVTACAGHDGDDCVDDPAGEGDFLGQQINTAATDTWYDGVDQDCNGLSDYDRDLDGEDCDASLHPECAGSTGKDCVDDPEGEEGFAGNQINSEVAETWYDGYDQNCDGGDDYDQDGDGYSWDGVTGGDDCDDEKDTVYPGAPEVAGDSVDQDCDGDDLLVEDDPVDDTGETTEGGCGCTTAPTPVGSLAWLLGLVTLVGRRRT